MLRKLWEEGVREGSRKRERERDRSSFHAREPRNVERLMTGRGSVTKRAAPAGASREPGAETRPRPREEKGGEAERRPIRQEQHERKDGSSLSLREERGIDAPDRPLRREERGESASKSDDRSRPSPSSKRPKHESTNGQAGGSDTAATVPQGHTLKEGGGRERKGHEDAFREGNRRSGVDGSGRGSHNAVWDNGRENPAQGSRVQDRAVETGAQGVAGEARKLDNWGAQQLRGKTAGAVVAPQRMSSTASQAVPAIPIPPALPSHSLPSPPAAGAGAGAENYNFIAHAQAATHAGAAFQQAHDPAAALSHAPMVPGYSLDTSAPEEQQTALASQLPAPPKLHQQTQAQSESKQLDTLGGGVLAQAQQGGAAPPASATEKQKIWYYRDPQVCTRCARLSVLHCLLACMHASSNCCARPILHQ
jgi:hypothetical protein